MKTLLRTLSAALLSFATPALANMPPANLDLGNNSMSERKILSLYSKLPGFDAIELHRVKFGEAEALCIKLARELKLGEWTSLPKYGCSLGSVIVYSYDTRLLAWSRHRNYDSQMANHVLRHEFAHMLFAWPADHPGACEASCKPEDQ